MNSILIERKGNILLAGVQEVLPQSMSKWVAIRPSSRSEVRFYIKKKDIVAVYDEKGGITRIHESREKRIDVCERNCLVRVKGGTAYLGDRNNIPEEFKLAGDRAKQSIFLNIGTGGNMIVQIPENEIERLFSI